MFREFNIVGPKVLLHISRMSSHRMNYATHTVGILLLLLKLIEIQRKWMNRATRPGISNDCFAERNKHIVIEHI